MENNNIKIVIDAGHGGSDVGAVSGNVKEKDLTLMIAQDMYEKLKKLGLEVTLIRSTDETLSPTERVRRIMEAYGDNENVIVISNHINSNPTPNSAEGAEVIYALRNDSTFAQNILRELGKEGQVIRGAYQRRSETNPNLDYYFIHRQTGSTQPVIIEYGFINNEEDLRRIQENYKSYVDAVIRAIIETFNVKVNQNDQSSSNTNQGNEIYINYIVKRGDTLYSIAKKYNTTVNSIKNLNSLVSDNIGVGQTLRIPITNNYYFLYTIKKGDTLWNIAREYNTTVENLRNLNNIQGDLLNVNQIIKIPLDIATVTIYTVEAGDTLWSISRKFDTTVDKIKRINNLESNIISIGQNLLIPIA